MSNNIKISFDVFDNSFFESIPGHEQVSIKKDGVYHNFLVGGERAGVVGFIPTQNNRGEKLYFVQIALSDKFRGKGLTKLAEDLLAEKYDIPILYATIEKDNEASIKAHLKAGFQEMEEETLDSLYKNGFLRVSQTRLFKRFKPTQ